MGIVNSLAFMMIQFSLYLWVTSKTPKRIYLREKTNLEIYFLTESLKRGIHKITPPRKSKKPTIHENMPQQL